MAVHVAMTVALALVPVALAIGGRNRLRPNARRLPLTHAVAMTAAGAAVGLFADYLRRLALVWSHAFAYPESVAAGSEWLLRAPAEELGVFLVVLMVYRRSHPEDRGSLLGYAVVVQGGLAAVRIAHLVGRAAPSWVSVAQAALAATGYLFAAGLWGLALGAGRNKKRWIAVALVSSIAIHALWEYILFERGPGGLLVLIPLALAMGILGASGVSRHQTEHAPSISSDRLALLLAHLPDPPTLEELREALGYGRYRVRPVWVAIGCLVYTGAALCSLCLAVYLSNRFGIDLASADERNLYASAPILLLGAAVVGSYLVAGYVQTRAGGSKAILEPVLAAVLTSATAAALVSTADRAVFTMLLSISPLAIFVAAAGAWWASHRERTRKVRALTRHVSMRPPSG